MKPITISAQGIMTIFGKTIAVLFLCFCLFVISVIIWEEANSSWWWKVPVGLGSFISFLLGFAGIAWIYEKNPTIKIGGKPKLPTVARRRR